MGSHSPGLIRNVYIFQKDYEAMIKFLCDEANARGHLFGLWTTEGEPVIHFISGQRSLCREKGSNPTDISRKDCPLSHIGNWRYYDYSASFETSSSQADYPRCSHERERFLELRLNKTALHDILTVTAILFGFLKHGALTLRRETYACHLVFLPAESPFKLVKGTNEIAIRSRLDGSFDTAEQMEWSSSHYCSQDYPSNSPKLQSHTLAGNTWSRKQVETEEIPLSITAKQNRALHVTGNRRFQLEGDFALSNRDFNVFMFKEDYQMMEKLVLEYPNLETGGDLFGLWTSDGDAVLHAVLGPGRNCKRTGASFYQDVPYLKRNGELLTQDYMLCHIGEWHSHHQLRLFRPSHGDSSTVIRNYPRGARGFLLIIANIVHSSEVKLLPYLYTEKSTHDSVKVGNIVVLPSKNSFNGVKKIKQAKEMGREKKPHSQYVFSQSRYSYFQQSPTSPRGVRSTLARSPKVQKQRHNSGTYMPWKA